MALAALLGHGSPQHTARADLVEGNSLCYTKPLGNTQNCCPSPEKQHIFKAFSVTRVPKSQNHIQLLTSLRLVSGHSDCKVSVAPSMFLGMGVEPGFIVR